jgi:hypothetical protein
LGKYGSNVKELALHNIVVPNTRYSGGKGFSCIDINTKGFTLLNMCLLDIEEGLLGVKTRVYGKSAGNHKKSISESLDTKLDLAGDDLAGVLVEVLRAGDLKGAGSREDSLVFDSVLDGAESIANSVTGLSNRVIVGALDKDSAGEGVIDTLDKGVLVFAESLFVNDLGETHVLDAHVIDGVKELSSASKGNTLTIALFGATDTDDTGAGENFKGRGVNTLLVDNDEVLVCTVADLFLELNNLVHLFVGECALRSNKLFTLVSV